MMQNLPLVSVLIPTWNRAIYLAQAIESALSQKYQNLEIIVCDNASNDNTPSLVQRYLSDSRIRYVRNEINIGQVPNYKKCVVDEAKGDWFIILSDDDYFTDPLFISKAISMSILDSEVRLVFARGAVKYEKLDTEVPMSVPFDGILDGKIIFINRDLYITPVEFILCGLVFHRKTAIAYNPFDEPSNYCCDAGLYFNMCLDVKVAVLSESVCVYREHGSNTLRQPKSLLQQEAVLRMYFQLWNSALNSCSFSSFMLKKWKSRVLVRGCRNYLVGMRLDHKRPNLFKYSMNFIGQFRSVSSREIWLDLFFVLRYLLSYFPSLYSLSIFANSWLRVRIFWRLALLSNIF